MRAESCPWLWSQSHLLLDTQGMQAEEWPGLSDPPLVGGHSDGPVRIGLLQSPPQRSHPGATKEELAQTGCLHCIAGELNQVNSCWDPVLQGPGLHSVQFLAGRTLGTAGCWEQHCLPDMKEVVQSWAQACKHCHPLGDG